MIRSTRTGALLIALSLSGCMGAPEVAGDPADSSFGGGFAKADGTYELCDLRKVLELVNRSDMDRDGLLDVLDGISTRQRVVDNILAHRDGPDGVLGTGDDDLFDDLDELDSISYVGPVTLDRLIVAAAGECVVDLDTRPFIDAATFSGRTGGGWTRDNVELEATYTVENVTGARLREALDSTDSRGRTMFERIRKNSDLEAFTYGYAISEMPWDRRSHRLRERMPYIMLTIESGRFEPDSDTGVRELSLGTDIMDDVYFDTRGFDLVHHDLLLRGRARWDTPTEIRRLLIAAKQGSEVDEEGLKRAAKVDVRRDRPDAAQIASLVTDVQRGMVNWRGADIAIEPIWTIYQQLQTAGALPDIAGREAVLLLDPIAHLRSTRSRLHFNEARVSDVERLHRLGAERVTFAVAFADERIADGDLAGGDLRLIEQLASDGRAILDRSALAARANTRLSAAGLPAGFDATTLPDPTSFARPSSAEQVARLRVVAEAISEVLHDYSDLLDDCDRILSGADDRSWDDYADYFVAWMRSQDQTLGRNQTVDPYLERFESMDIATERPAFNIWVAAQRDDGDDDFEGFVEVDVAGWGRVEQALTLEMLKIHQRQIEAAGTAARALWFDVARAFYVPASRRQTSNLIIDTTDVTDMLSHAEWEGLTEEERRIDQDLPSDRVFHTTLVNEVQIELGSEVAYVERIAGLRALVDGGTASAEDEAALEGARFVFDAYRGALIDLAELKESRVRRYLRRGGADDPQWVPALRSKGQTALLMLADEL